MTEQEEKYKERISRLCGRAIPPLNITDQTIRNGGNHITRLEAIQIASRIPYVCLAELYDNAEKIMAWVEGGER